MAASRQEGVTEEDLPSELQGRLTTFDNALSKIEEVLDPLHSVPLSEIHAKVDALDKAKLDLIGVYAVNSLFWMYLNVKGENPKDHHVKTELDRIRGYMNRVKEIQEKQKAPKIDKDASKRFVRSALWQMAHKKAQEGAASTSAAAENSPQSSSSKSWQQSVITVSSQFQNSDSDSEESPAKKQKTGKKNRKKRKNKKK